MHPDQIRRLDEIPAHGTGNHQVEHIADEAQKHRRAQGEPRLDHPDQKIPAHIRDEQAALEDQHAEYKQAKVERVSEDRANLVAVLPEHQPQKRERQSDQHKIDGPAEPGPLRSCPTGMVFSHRSVSSSGCSLRWAQSTPLVEGISADRESGSTASRMARARPLKIASLMWWVLRP